jgi:hypothetical protein
MAASSSILSPDTRLSAGLLRIETRRATRHRDRPGDVGAADHDRTELVQLAARLMADHRIGCLPVVEAS